MAPIKVYAEEGGPFALVETLEDAAALMRKLGWRAPTGLTVLGKSSLSEAESLSHFWAGINKNARIFLTCLFRHKDGVKGDRFSEEINMPVEKFGGVLGGASKIAKKHGLKFEKIVESEMKTEGTQRYRWLCPGPLLLKFGKELTSEVVSIQTNGKITVGA